MRMMALAPWLAGAVFSIGACSSSSGGATGSDAGENFCQGKSIGPAIIDADRFISFRAFGDPRVRPDPPCQAPADAGLDADDASASLDAGDAEIPDAAAAPTTCDAGPPPCYESADLTYDRDNREVSRNACPSGRRTKVLSAEESERVESALRAIEGFEGEGKACGSDGSSSAMYVGTGPTNIRRGYTSLMLGHSSFYNVTHVAQYQDVWKLLGNSLPLSAP